jgi:protein-tyrosine phosphatase
MKVASGYGGARMCVHEDGPEYEGQCYFLPILITKPNSKLDRTGAVASLYKIGDASNIIDQIVKSGQDILVHCQGGIERSPLVVAWYLTFKAKMFDTLFDAYLFLKMRRPVVSNRLSWLP